MKKAFLPFVMVMISILASTGMRVSQDGIRLSKNIHVVDEGKFYRSAQLTKAEFLETIEKYGIKTVVNLQGDRPGYKWYDDEIAAVKESGVDHFNISMATENIPRKENLVKLLEIFKDAKRPILIHCRAGADRTGEASAIYALEYMGKTKEEALDMLHWKYFHVEMFAPSKKYFVNLYQGQSWARRSYDHCNRSYHFSDRRNCPTTVASNENPHL